MGEVWLSLVSQTLPQTGLGANMCQIPDPRQPGGPTLETRALVCQTFAMLPHPAPVLSREGSLRIALPLFGWLLCI